MDVLQFSVWSWEVLLLHPPMKSWLCGKDGAAGGYWEPVPASLPPHAVPLHPSSRPLQVCQVFTLGKWVANLVARLLALAALWVRIQTSLKVQNGPPKYRSGQHTLARPKNIQESIYLPCILSSLFGLGGRSLKTLICTLFVLGNSCHFKKYARH